MGISESRIRQIIREETERMTSGARPIHEGGGEFTRQLFEQIAKICDEALLNKSLGADARVGEKYAGKISALIQKASLNYDPNDYDFGRLSGSSDRFGIHKSPGLPRRDR